MVLQDLAMKDEINRLGIQHLNYLGDLLLVSRATKRNIKSLKEKGSWDWGDFGGYSIRDIDTYVFYLKKTGVLVGIDKTQIQDFAIIEKMVGTDKKIIPFYVVGPYQIQDPKNRVYGLLTVRNLIRMEGGKICGEGVEHVELNEIITYKSMGKLESLIEI